MIIKALNSYRIIHKNGAIEDINADSIMTALSNLTISEEESAVLTVTLVKENVRTLVEEPEPDTEPDPDPEPEAPEDNPEENPDNTEIGGDVDFGESN